MSFTYHTKDEFMYIYLMGEFVVSALKYRPQNFVDVVGQQAITQTLQNAIDLGKIAKAMLFCGPRGVGKTTCARIFAKKINSGTGEVDPNEDFAFNVFELDAASNNSVADIRNLIEQVRIPPQKGIYKVYIIDEVHMLSSAAFNAFLKTLEEPPQHAIFILATTEKQKIIPTILSRCQIFDFKRISIKDAEEYLKTIASREGVDAEAEALHLIAQKADGAMRDALSIFDRMVSYSGATLTAKHVSVNLNILDYDSYLKITSLLISGDLHQSILNFNEIIDLGFDGYHFINGLSKHFRDLLMCQNKGTATLLEVGPETEAKFLAQAEAASASFLLQALTLTNTYALQYKSSLNQHLQVELCLMQIASLEEGEKKKVKSYIKPHQPGSTPKSTPSETHAESKDITVPIEEVVKPVTSPTLDENISISQPEQSIPEIIESEDAPIQLDLKIKSSVSGLSLSSLRVQKEHQNKTEETSAEGIMRNEDVDQEALEASWNIYTEEMVQKGERNMVALLQLDIPRLKNQTEIHLTVTNDTNRVELEKQNSILLRSLRERLKNDHLSIHIHVDEKEDKKFVYTAEDKFKEIKAKKPIIELFKTTFNLEY
ncbi:MAG: DNA polymerase III subunit gamma/tau [Flavobacteriaceae bacterium]|nr:DNA polymerase III subunit gamma/tau [Flavobacteriaceae bacterium]